MSQTLPFWLDPRPAARIDLPLSGALTDLARPGALTCEILGVEAARRHYDAWIDLTKRALEPNVFFEPAFALAAAQHFAIARKPRFLMVWRQKAGVRQLVGLSPVLLPRRGLPGRASLWRHDQSSSAVPLLDAAIAPAVFTAMLSAIAKEAQHVSALLIPRLPLHGAAAQVLRAAATGSGRELRLYDEHQRAVFTRESSDPEQAVAGLSAKKHKELRRQWRRLAEGAELRITSARTPAEVRQAAEEFLALEARGWKGRAGTALLGDPGLATFTRTALRALAAEGKCRIDLLLRAGVPIAAAVVLTSGGRAFYWKTAYDEAYAEFSTGVQLSIETTRLQIAESGVDLTDSGAIENHPMIDRLWRGRIDIGDALIAVEGKRSVSFDAVAAREAATRSLKSRAKKALHALKGGKWS